jgi:hypothetical protein
VSIVTVQRGGHGKGMHGTALRGVAWPGQQNAPFGERPSVCLPVSKDPAVYTILILVRPGGAPVDTVKSAAATLDEVVKEAERNIRQKCAGPSGGHGGPRLRDREGRRLRRNLVCRKETD